MKNLFTDHPAEVGETYFEHLKSALEITGRLAVATHCHLLHAVLPFIKPPFRNDLETLIKDLNQMKPECRAGKKDSCHLDEVLDDLAEDHLDEYEEVVELYKTYGGD